jgi:hypothetical protein
MNGFSAEELANQLLDIKHSGIRLGMVGCEVSATLILDLFRVRRFLRQFKCANYNVRNRYLYRRESQNESQVIEERITAGIYSPSIARLRYRMRIVCKLPK